MTMICKNCGKEVHLLSHVCDKYDMPVNIQIKKSDLGIIVDALQEYGMTHSKALEECVEERDYFLKLYKWFVDQYRTC